jgi:hypothetical protein
MDRLDSNAIERYVRVTRFAYAFIDAYDLWEVASIEMCSLSKERNASSLAHHS